MTTASYLGALQLCPSLGQSQGHQGQNIKIQHQYRSQLMM